MQIIVRTNGFRNLSSALTSLANQEVERQQHAKVKIQQERRKREFQMAEYQRKCAVLRQGLK